MIRLRKKERKKKVAHPLFSLKQSLKSTEQLRFSMSEMKRVWEARTETCSPPKQKDQI